MDLFDVEKQGSVTTLRLKPTDSLVGHDVEDRDPLLRALYEAGATQQKVLIFEVPEGRFSPAAVDRVLERGQEILAQKGPRFKGELHLLLSLQYTYEWVINFLHESRMVVVAAFDGEVDFDLLGLLLGCDYRICSERARLVNRVVERGVGPASALLWYLSRSLGDSQAMGLLLEGRSLDASEARDLGLVNQVAPLEQLGREARALADRLAGKPTEALHSLLAARAATNSDLARYLKEFGVGFEHLPRQDRGRKR
jgi:enoyl-CoA hydratase/carnithine racemase